MNTMKTWNRWQELTPKMLGVLLIIVPFVFGIETFGSNSWNAWLLGAVVGVVAIVLALLWFGSPRNRVTHWSTVMLGVVLFITPWVMGQSLLSAGALASSIVGALLVVATGRVLMENRSRQSAFPAYRPLGSGSMESSTSDGYR